MCNERTDFMKCVYKTGYANTKISMKWISIYNKIIIMLKIEFIYHCIIF